MSSRAKINGASLHTSLAEEAILGLMLCFTVIAVSLISLMGGYQRFYAEIMERQSGFFFDAQAYRYLAMFCVYAPLLCIFEKARLPVLWMQLIGFTLLHAYTAFEFKIWNYLTHLLFLYFLCLVWVSAHKAGRTSNHSAQLTLLLCKFIIAMVYFQAFLSKLIHGGLEWVESGSVIRLYGYMFDTRLGRYISHKPLMAELLAWSSLAMELVVPWGLFFKRTVVASGWVLIVFHIMNYFLFDIMFWHLMIPIFIIIHGNLFSEVE